MQEIDGIIIRSQKIKIKTKKQKAKKGYETHV